MPTWNAKALTVEREARGFSVETMAEAMRDQTGRGSVNTVRKIEGRIKVDGVIQLPSNRSIERYVQTLNSREGFPQLEMKAFETPPLRLLEPDFVDLRPHGRVSDSPNDTSWRASRLRLGIGPLALEADTTDQITILEVKLSAEELFRVLQDREPSSSSYAASRFQFNHVLSLEHWCSWTAESRSTDYNYGHLGIVNRDDGAQSNQPFRIVEREFRQEAMFSTCPEHVTWSRFVRTWEQEPIDISFNLTVRYRSERKGVDTLRSEFELSGKKLQRYCAYGLKKLKRGFPAQMQPYIVGKVDSRVQPKIVQEE